MHLGCRIEIFNTNMSCKYYSIVFTQLNDYKNSNHIPIIQFNINHSFILSLMVSRKVND